MHMSVSTPGGKHVCVCACVHVCMCACVYVCMCVCVHVCAYVCMVDRHRCGMHFAFSMSDNTLIGVQVGMHESCHCESSIPLSTHHL